MAAPLSLQEVVERLSFITAMARPWTKEGDVMVGLNGKQAQIHSSCTLGLETKLCYQNLNFDTVQLKLSYVQGFV